MILLSPKVEILIPHVGYIFMEGVSIYKDSKGTLMFENDISFFEMNHTSDKIETDDYVIYTIASTEVKIWKSAN